MVEKKKRGRPRSRRNKAAAVDARGWRDGRTDDPRYQRILKIVELARVARGWNRGDLEAALGRGNSYLKRVLEGPVELRVTDLLRAVDVLEIRPEEVLGPLVLGVDPAPGTRPDARPPGGETTATADLAAETGRESLLREIAALVARLVDEAVNEALRGVRDGVEERAAPADSGPPTPPPGRSSSS